MLPITNPLPFVLVIATVFGVLLHDTQVNNAATIAIVNPAAYADFANFEVVSKSNEHLHVEKVAVYSQDSGVSRLNPHIQARDDDRRYVQSKKAAYSGGDNHGFWPST